MNDTDVTIPDELKSCKQWICAGKDKRPIPSVGWQKPENHHLYEQVDPQPYRGFVLTKKDEFLIIDVDDPEKDNRASDTNEFQDELIDSFKSKTFIERSMSGKGYHIVCRGKLPNGKSMKSFHDVGIEFFSWNKQVVITGRKLDFSPNKVATCQEAIDRVFEKLESRVTKKSKDKSTDKKCRVKEPPAGTVMDDVGKFKDRSPLALAPAASATSAVAQAAPPPNNPVSSDQGSSPSHQQLAQEFLNLDKQLQAAICYLKDKNNFLVDERTWKKIIWGMCAVHCSEPLIVQTVCTDGKHNTEEQCRRAIKDFNPDKTKTGAIIGIAKDAGWLPPQQKTSIPTLDGVGVTMVSPSEIGEPPPEMAWRTGARGDSRIFVGLAGTGKSSLLAYQLFCLATGNSLYGKYLPAKKGKVVLFTEDSNDKTMRKFRGFCKSAVENIIIVQATVEGWQAIRRIRPSDGVLRIIVDTIANCKSIILTAEEKLGKINPDENRPDFWNFMKILNEEMIRETGAGRDDVHHSCCLPEGKRTARSLIRGSSAIEGAYDIVQINYAIPGEGNLRHVECCKEKERETYHFTVMPTMVDGTENQWGESTKIITGYHVVDENLPEGALLDFAGSNETVSKKETLEDYMKEFLPRKFGEDWFSHSDLTQAIKKKFRPNKGDRKIRNYLWKNSNGEDAWLEYRGAYEGGVEQWRVLAKSLRCNINQNDQNDQRINNSDSGIFGRFGRFGQSRGEAPTAKTLHETRKVVCDATYVREKIVGYINQADGNKATLTDLINETTRWQVGSGEVREEFNVMHNEGALVDKGEGYFGLA